MELSRRSFLVGAGATTVLLSLRRLALAGLASSGAPPGPTLPDYRGWEDVYRQQWTWDRVVHASHNRANCASACAWNVYVRDGVVWREEQAAVYDQDGRSGAPDFFPRGCQKGACYSTLMHSPQRLRYPVERVGERGSGTWRRISWGEAFDKIAEAVIAAATTHGPETVVGIAATNFDCGPDTAAEQRFLRLAGAAVLDSSAGIGDIAVGFTQTYGMTQIDGTSDDYFRSDCVVLWSVNPVYTRIPDAHFFTEARYRGARVVVISPDYNATAIHADLWLNPKLQSDAALALAMAQVIISETLHKEDYVKEQTDLPFLVRTDTQRFLRERDLVANGRDDAFYVWDQQQGAAVLAPGTQGMKRASLALGDIRPALDGRRLVQLANGARVEVEPLFEMLRRQLNQRSTPEMAEKATGISAAVIRRVARELAAAKSAIIYASAGACKHHHSDLMHRSFALLMALTGNQGRPGGGLRNVAWWEVTGFDELALGEMPATQKLAMRVMGRPDTRDIESAMVARARSESFTPLLPWLYVHGGYASTMGAPAYNDGGNPLAMDAAMKAAVERGWLPIFPPAGKDPKVFLVSAINPLRQWPAPQIARRSLWPKFDLIVTVDVQMSTTATQSDIVLPAAGFYEKVGIKYGYSFVPYLVLNDKAVEPLGESRPEWWIYGALAKRIQESARARGATAKKNAAGKEVDLTKLFDLWNDGGAFDPDDPRTGMKYIFERSETCAGLTWGEAIARGVIPIKRQGLYSVFNNMCSDIDFTQPLYPNAWQVEKKESWPTLTGRQQFYLDHDWYVNAGEALPVHKPAPAQGGNHPLRMTGGHTRWSIHSLWRSEATMLRLQRGEPVVYMNKDDAGARGIADGDRVKVFNDVGAFECLVKLAPAAQPGQVIIYHAWEPFQFAKRKGQQEPIPAAWKALHLVAGYGQLHYRPFYGTPNFGPRGISVEVQKA